MAPRGMLGEAALSIKPLKKRLFLALARGMGFFMDRVRWHASSEQEAADSRKAFHSAQTAVAPKHPGSGRSSEIASRPDDSWNIAFIVGIHRVKNLHFGLQAFLGAQASMPVTVNFIGPVEDAAFYAESTWPKPKTRRSKWCSTEGSLPPFEEVAPHFHAAHFLVLRRPTKISATRLWKHGPMGARCSSHRIPRGAALRRTTSGGIGRSMNRNGTPD